MTGLASMMQHLIAFCRVAPLVTEKAIQKHLPQPLERKILTLNFGCLVHQLNVRILSKLMRVSIAD